MIRYDTQFPQPVFVPRLEVGETLYDLNCGFREWMGAADDLFNVERVFDPAQLDVQVTNQTTSGVTFRLTAIGAVPEDEPHYVASFALRANTVGGQKIGPIEYRAVVIPSLGAAQP